MALEDALGTAASATVHRWAEVNGMAVDIDRREYGHSSARVAAVFLRPPGGAPERKIILKAFDVESAGDNEVLRHQAAQQDAPEFAERHLVALPFLALPYGTHGVVMYQEVAAGGRQDHRPLRELLGTPSAAAVVGRLCGSLLTEWNATGTSTSTSSIAELLQDHLGVRIRPGGRIWSWADPVPELLRSPSPWLEIHGDLLPNPLAFALSPRLSTAPPLRVHSGKVHGDLHANNIMCSAPGDDRPIEFRLIDLASYDSDGPLARDQSTLLMSVVRRSLEEMSDPGQRNRLMLHLLGEQGTDGLPATPCEAIAAITATGERWAEQHGLLEEWRRQFQVASVSSALVLTGRPTLPPADRWWFFVLAARQLAALLTRLGAHHARTPFTIDDAMIAALSSQPAPAAEARRPTARPDRTPPNLVKPRRAWRQRQRHRIHVANLRNAASDDEFTRLACAYLSMTFGSRGSNTQVTPVDTVPGLVLVDTADGGGRRLRVAVQLARLRSGDDWYESCAAESTERIRQFQLSGLDADQYLFCHNQNHRDERYNEAVLTALEPLTALGDVGWTGVWDGVGLVGHMWQAVYDRCKAVISDYTASAVAAMGAVVRGDDPVTEVPFQRYVAVFSPYGLDRVGPHEDHLADPVPDLLGESTGIHLVVGEFGLGKTTVVVRATKASRRRVLLLPAARLAADVTNLHGILSTILREADEDAGAHQDLWREIAPGSLEVMLAEPNDDIRLVVDGLDEAPMVQRRSGVLDFLQSLRKVRVPVLVSVRSEFWNSRLDEVRVAMAEPGENSMRQHITATEMRPWTTDCMVGLIDKSLRADGPNDHLSEFRLLVEQGRYGQVYGDIPRRPMFLDMVIEDVRQAGVRPRSRLELFSGWIDRKIERDWYNPSAVGGVVRPPVRGTHPESLDLTKRRAYQVMAFAARAMTSFDDAGLLVLLPTVAVDDVLESGPAWFTDVDPEALVVQSVLLPAEGRSLGNAARFRFAHQAFHEYFLALSLHRTPGDAIESAAPPEVLEWLREMRSSGLG